MGARVGEGRLPEQPQLANDFELNINNVGTRPRRKMFRAIPEAFVPGVAPICLDTNDVPTIVDGVQSRLFRKRPSIDVDLMARFNRFVERWVKKHLTPLEKVLTFEEWIEKAPYTVERKKELMTVYSRIKGQCPSKKAQKNNSFIKTESYPEFKHARPINSRCDEFKVFTGPYFKSIEESVFQNTWFIKHVPIDQRPKLISGLKKLGRKYVSSDFSAFEGSFLPPLLLACECVLYRYMLGNFPAMAEFICSVISGKNVLRFRRGVSVSTMGHRMSGDMCTSLGNGFTNLMVWWFLMEDKSVSEEDWEGYVEGDDGIFSFPENIELDVDIYSKLGFIIKLEYVKEPEDASFCGIRGIDGENVRDPFHFIQTFGWTATDIGARPNKLKSLLRAKALSAVYETPQCPIIRAYADWALKHTRGVVPKFVSDGYHNTDVIPRCEEKLPAFNPSSRIRLRFATLFGISIPDQIRLEGKLRLAGPACLVELPTSHAVSEAWKCYTEYG